jgi:hypothetical protein
MKEITWLAKNSEAMPTEELFDFLTEICNPDQTGIIMDHISLLESNMLIGYDEKDVYVMFVNEDENEIMKITKT